MWEELGRPSIPSLEDTLTGKELLLLQHIVTETRSESQPVTLEQVERLMDAKKYSPALLQALLLKRHRVQALWTRGQIGAIHALALGTISRSSRQEIIGISDRKRVYAFTLSSQELWSLQLDAQVIAVQTAHLDADRLAKILVCTSNNQISEINGVKQNGNRRSPVEGELRHTRAFKEHITSLYVNASGGRTGTLEIIVGVEEEKIYVYGRNLEQLLRTIVTPQGIRVVSAHVVDDDQTPAIVAGSTGDTEHIVYAYNRLGDLLWHYAAKGRIEALYIKDIDADDRLEVIVGSQDRNIHVLDQNGELKWRYFLSDIVMSVDTCDIDGDNKIELLVGCGDELLYVFSREGDLLWTYQAFGSVRAVRAGDIDADGNIEIVLGTECQLEVVRVVNQRRLQELIDECWYALQQHKHTDALIREFLDSQAHDHLRAFALYEMAKQKRQRPEDFEIFENFVKDGSLEVRKALIHALVACYDVHPQRAQHLFSQLLMDQELEIKLLLVKHVARLMKQGNEQYWDDGFRYLQRLARNNERFVRRAVMKELYTLVEDFYGKPRRKRTVFELLLNGLLEPEVSTISTLKASDWVRQEAAHTLARFLDLHYADLIMYLNRLIAKGVRPEILQRVAYHAKAPFIKHIFQDLGMFIFDLNENNVLERLRMAIGALEETKSLRYGNDTLILYKQLDHLLRLYTIEDIALYQCNLKERPTTSNIHFNAVVTVLTHLNLITRALRSYLRRDGIKERVDSLLEANKHIENVCKLAEEQYSVKSLDEPLSTLPDYYVVKLLLKRWQILVTNELYRLSGRAELAADIQTNGGYFEEQVVVGLLLRNKGRATADNVHIELLHSDQFEVIGKKTFETDAIFAQDEVEVEFTIRPFTQEPYLAFEIVYTDTEEEERREYYEDQLELRPLLEKEEFLPIPNPYSTGVPTLSMCYGREADLKFLRDNLTRSAATLLILHGQRRTGKTTLLFQLVNIALLYPHIPLLIDMQNESYGISAPRFFYRIAFYIAQALAKRGIVVPCGDEEDFKKELTFTLGKYLDNVESRLGDSKLVILIDEFEVLQAQVEKQALAPEVFEYLRSIVQHRPNITLLFSGVHTIQELTGEYWSTFFNIADHYRLSKLSEQGAVHLITSPVKDYLTYEPYAIKKIRQLTADQPYLIHLVCRPLVDYCNEREKTYVTLNDVNTNLDEIMEKGRHHFQWIWDQSSQDEHYVLAMLAEAGGNEGRILSLVELEEQYEGYVIPYTRESILASLASLIEKDIVTKVLDDVREGTPGEERYKISIGLVRSWLRRVKPVRQVLREENVQR